MTFPPLTPGQRFSWPCPRPGADALWLSQWASQSIEPGGKTHCAVVCADAQDAQRLLDELVFFQPQLRCALFPDWETLPYDLFSPHQDLISERLATLWRILQGEVDVVLIPATTALYRVAPPSFLAAHTFSFKVQQSLREQDLKDQLTLAGYQHVGQVMSPGEYTVRGGLIDLFPMGASLPFRIDLFDDLIDAIRTFDPDTQRSLYPVQEVRLLPGREFPMDEPSRQGFRARWREFMPGDPTQSRLYKDIGAGLATAGIEYYLPLFFEETATVFDYIGAQAKVVLHGELEPVFQRFWQDTQDRYRLSQGDPDRPVLPPEHLFLSQEQFYLRLKPHAQLALRPPSASLASLANPTNPTGHSQPADPSAPVHSPEERAPENRWSSSTHLSLDRNLSDPASALRGQLQNTSQRTLIVAESLGRRQSLHDLLASHGLDLPFVDDWPQFLAKPEVMALTVGPLQSGFSDHELGLVILTESELFASAPASRRRRQQEAQSDVAAMIRDLSELQLGDPVVHSAHGIGRYQGLIHLTVSAQANQDE
ncbi:MAG: putative transcription-repair coupling factor, partial [Pseudomonadota bacterium]